MALTEKQARVGIAAGRMVEGILMALIGGVGRDAVAIGLGVVLGGVARTVPEYRQTIADAEAAFGRSDGIFTSVVAELMKGDRTNATDRKLDN